MSPNVKVALGARTKSPSNRIPYSGKFRGLKLLIEFKLGFPHVVEYNGTMAEFYHDTLQGYYSVVNSEREGPVVEHLLDNVHDDDVFYDVGANLGFYTCLVGRHQPGVETVSFEPYPPNVRLLRRNVQRNDVDATIVDAALSDEFGEATFTTMQTDRGGAQEAGIDNEHLRHRSDRPASTTTVETLPGDALVERDDVPPPTVVKLDAEGVGESVMRGLESSLSRPACRLVYVEPHENDARLEALLREFGFEVDTIPLDSRVSDAFLVGYRPC